MYTYMQEAENIKCRD